MTFKINISQSQVEKFKRELFFEQNKQVELLYKNSHILYNGSNLNVIAPLRSLALTQFRDSIRNWIKTRRIVDFWVEQFSVSIKPHTNIMENGQYFTAIDVNLEWCREKPDLAFRILHAIYIEDYNFVQKRSPVLEDRSRYQ